MRRTRTAPPPDLLPVLGVGAHRRPEDGACLMEYVSVLSGDRFTDHPRCTHRAAATLARLVNDGISDDELRNQLALLAPSLVDIHGQDERVGKIVVMYCLRAAQRVAQVSNQRPDPRLSRRVDEAQTQLERLERLEPKRQRPPWQRAWWALKALLRCDAEVKSAFDVFLSRTQGLDSDERDVLLCLLLVAVVSGCRRAVAPAPCVGAPTVTLRSA